MNEWTCDRQERKLGSQFTTEWKKLRWNKKRNSWETTAIKKRKGLGLAAAAAATRRRHAHTIFFPTHSLESYNLTKVKHLFIFHNLFKLRYNFVLCAMLCCICIFACTREFYIILGAVSVDEAAATAVCHQQQRRRRQHHHPVVMLHCRGHKCRKEPSKKHLTLRCVRCLYTFSFKIVAAAPHRITLKPNMYERGWKQRDETKKKRIRCKWFLIWFVSCVCVCVWGTRKWEHPTERYTWWLGCHESEASTVRGR